MRDFKGYQHTNLISFWKLYKDDQPDGLILHDYASYLSMVTTTTDYGGTTFNIDTYCGYLESSCGADIPPKHVVFKDANHYDV